MGFNISWIGFNGLERAECLSRLAMNETSIVDEANEAPFSLAVLPNNWIILFANDPTYVSDARLAELSRGATTLGCQVLEGPMLSIATLFNDGAKVWSISHFPKHDVFDLEVVGTLPAEIDAIRTRLVAEQSARGGAKSDTDFIFDVPIDAARFVTGYRHDESVFDWGEPVFHELKPGRRRR